MDISAAALPPIQPAISSADRKHPRFREYQNYRAGMSAKLLEADAFSLWLRNIEEREDELANGREVVFHAQPGATLPDGWYKHKFAPGTGKMTRHGPFATSDQASAA